MSRRPAIITQADVARVIRAAQQTGAGVIEVKPDGSILILLGKRSAADEAMIDRRREITFD